MPPGQADPAHAGPPEVAAAFRAVAKPSRRIPVAVTLAAVGVLAAALLAKQLDPATSVPAPVTASPQPPAHPVAVVEEAAPATTPLPSSWPPDRNRSATPRPTFDMVSTAAGTTQVVPAGPTDVRLTIVVPPGWQKASDAMYVKEDGASPTGMSFGAWHLQHVNVVPCRWSSEAFADPAPMRSAEGQAQALSSWWGQDPFMRQYGNSSIAPLATRPRPTTVNGHDAWYVEVLIPSYLDHSDCDGGQVILWDTASGEVRYSLGPRELNRLWVMDVGGEVLVVDAASFVPTRVEDEAELQAIVDSMVIEP